MRQSALWEAGQRSGAEQERGLGTRSAEAPYEVDEGSAEEHARSAGGRAKSWGGARDHRLWLWQVQALWGRPAPLFDLLQRPRELALDVYAQKEWIGAEQAGSSSSDMAESTANGLDDAGGKGSCYYQAERKGYTSSTTDANEPGENKAEWRAPKYRSNQLLDL